MKKTSLWLNLGLIIACILMAIIELYITPSYLIKSIYKLILFMAVPFLFALCSKDINFKAYFKIKSRKQLLYSFLLGLAVYFFILVAYFILKSFIDLDIIALELQKSLNVNSSNFIFVAIYISLINSLLEEFFFRGFAFFSLKRHCGRSYAYIVSSLLFSLYHIAIIAMWFNWMLVILMIVGLFLTGLLFNWLNEKNENIYNSWLLHIFANLAINTIGLFMFSII